MAIDFSLLFKWSGVVLGLGAILLMCSVTVHHSSR